MKILFSIQRYGDRFVGGAEKYVRSLATHLAARGHEISVFTSCATSYADWADDYEPGMEDDRGVTVHRHRVAAPRDNDRFIPLHLRAVDRGRVPLWPWAQDRWARTMGPDLRPAAASLESLAADADVTVIVGYHYAHALDLSSTAAAVSPTMVVPTAHPEGAFHIGRVGDMFRYADRTLCLAPEEADLVAAVHAPRAIDVVPCPVEPLRVPTDGEIEAVLDANGLERDRYVIVVGRIDPAKGSDDAIRFMAAHRRRIDPGLRLVVVGPGGNEEPPPGVVQTGFVDDATKDALVAGASVLLQPSYMESFSYSLMEGWQLARPALIQARSSVLAGHARRGGGGIAYEDHADFEAALVALTDDPDLGDRLGRAGASYVARTFDPDLVADAFVEAAERTRRDGNARLRRREEQ